MFLDDTSKSGSQRVKTGNAAITRDRVVSIKKPRNRIDRREEKGEQEILRIIIPMIK